MSDGEDISSVAAPRAAVVAGGHSEPCSRCRRALPLRLKRPGEIAGHWECAACHTPLTGILLKDAALKNGDSIRIGHVHFDPTGVPVMPPALRQLVKEFVESRRQNPPTDERRSAPRIPQELDVTILLLDENWTPHAKPLLGMVIDLSAHGLGMVTTTAIEASYIAVQLRLPGGMVQILGQIVWAKDIGHGFFNSGMQFLLRFGRSTSSSAPPAAQSAN